MDRDPTFAPPLSALLTASAIQQVASTVQPSNIAGYPNDATRFLSGDGTWRPPATAWFIDTVGNDNLLNNAAGVPVANQAVLGPVRSIATIMTITTLQFQVLTQSGNMDVGIYYTDDKGVTFRRAVSTGSFAMPAAALVAKTVASTLISPIPGRRWYTAMAIDNITARVMNFPTGSTNLAVAGYLKATSLPLPTTITGATVANNWFGIVGF